MVHTLYSFVSSLLCIGACTYEPLVAAHVVTGSLNCAKLWHSLKMELMRMERISVYLCQHYAWAPIAHVESMLVQHFGLLYLKVKMALHFSAMRMHTEIIVRYRYFFTLLKHFYAMVTMILLRAQYHTMTSMTVFIQLLTTFSYYWLPSCTVCIIVIVLLRFTNHGHIHKSQLQTVIFISLKE